MRGRLDEVCLGLWGEQQGSTGLLIEVEVLGQVAQDLLVLAHVGPRIRPPVRLRVEPLPAQEAIACPLGKPYPLAGAGDLQRWGRALLKTALSRTSSSTAPP
jgi:hypothetical protein